MSYDAKILDELYSLHDYLKDQDSDIDSCIDSDRFRKARLIIKNMANNPLAYSDEMIRIAIESTYIIYDESESGSVIITDSEYDNLTKEYIRRGNHPIYYSPKKVEGSKKWDIKKHPNPELVGSITKVYTDGEVEEYIDMILRKYPDAAGIMVAPKYDGVSCAMEIRDGVIEYALTRKTGVEGQDIRLLVKSIMQEMKMYLKDGLYKCEIVMSSNKFAKMIQEWGNVYKNRRSAVSGIINTPTNLHLAKYLTILPLVHIGENAYPRVMPSHKYYKRKYLREHTSLFIEDIKDQLLIYKSAEYGTRVDGVVIYPAHEDHYLAYYSEKDLLEDCIAYKTNSAKGYTRVKYVYPSVGRTGRITPMLKVEPVEVNETTVEDASLSTIEKYVSMNIHEGETVEIISSGDVIPMASTLSPKVYPDGAPLIEMDMKCPYCRTNLEMIGKYCICPNKVCPGVLQGRIVNFITVLGIKGVSDKTIETLFEADIVRSIEDIFILLDNWDGYVDAMERIRGFNNKSLTNLARKLKSIITDPFEESIVLASLGIPMLSKTTSRSLLKHYRWNQIEKSLHQFQMGLDPSQEIADELDRIPGIGEKMAITIAEGLRDNCDLLLMLIDRMQIIPDKEMVGSVVFTGFRDMDLESQFNDLGYVVKSSVSKNTNYLIAAKLSGEKFEKAKKLGIPIYELSNVGSLLQQLR